MTDLNKATQILSDIKAELDEAISLITPTETPAPEAAPAPAPTSETAPKDEGGITSKLLNTFNSIKENVESVIPTGHPTESAPIKSVPEMPAAEDIEPDPEETAPAMPVETPIATPATAEEPANMGTGSASENALNDILGGSAELPSQAKEAETAAPEAETEAEAPKE